MARRKVRRFPVTDYKSLVRLMFVPLKGKAVLVSFGSTEKKTVWFRNMIMRVSDVYEVAGEVIVKGNMKSCPEIQQEFRIPIDRVVFTFPDKGELMFNNEFGYVKLSIKSYESEREKVKRKFSGKY